MLSLLVVSCAFLSLSNAIEQPSLKNLRAVTTDYDTQSFALRTEKNELYYNHISGNYTSTGRPYSAYYAIL